MYHPEAWEEAIKPGSSSQLQAMIRFDNALRVFRALSEKEAPDTDREAIAIAWEKAKRADTGGVFEAEYNAARKQGKNEEWLAADKELAAARAIAAKKCRFFPFFIYGRYSAEFWEERRAREEAAKARAIALWQAQQQERALIRFLRTFVRYCQSQDPTGEAP